jgi:uncharacterized protein YdbL (DUF1318 family)
MQITRRRALSSLAAATLLAALPAFALTLDEARNQGLVAEGMNGYLIVVDPSAAGLAADINAQRRSVYQGTAADTGQPLSVVEALAGERQISRAQAGWLIETSSGIRAK